MSRRDGPGPRFPDPRRDVDDEVEDYIRRRARELEEQGLDPAEARRAAEQAFGDVDEVRAACVRIQRRRRVRMDLRCAAFAVVQDIRLGARSLVRRPGFATVAVLTLGLGVGVNTAIFSVVDAVLLAPLPYPEPERLVQVWESDPRRSTRNPSPADYLDIRRAARSFSDLTAYTTRSGNLTGEGEPESLAYASVSANFFRTFGVAAALGGTFGPDRVGSGVHVAVLSHDLWSRRFGTDPGAIGRTLRVDEASYEIVGVMPPSFDFPEGAAFWVAAPRDIPGSSIVPSDAPPMRDAWYHQVVGRLAPGVDIARAGQEMESLAASLAADFPDVNEGLRIRLVPLKQETVGDAGGTLWLLLGATGLVMLVACTNVANLLLARGVGRRRELAVRAALGAGGGRIVAHVLGEAIVLALAGGGVGGGLAVAGLAVLRPVVAAVLPRGGELQLDLGILAYAGAAALATTLLVGLMPARAAAVSGRAAGVARGATESKRRRRLGDALVAFQVAMAVVLVLGAGLMLRTLARVASVDLGFDAEDLTVAWVGLPGAGRRSEDERVAFYREIGDRLSTLPGARGVAWAQTSPLAGGPGAGLRVRDAVDGEERTPPDVRWQVVSADYFDVAGIPLLAGRPFTAADGPGADPVGIVSASLARLAFGDEDPLGRRINTGLDGRTRDGDWRWVTVVGVVADTRNRGPTRPPDPVLFRPMAQGGPGFSGSRMLAVVRTGERGDALAPLIRGAVWDVASEAPVYGLARGTALAGTYLGERRLVLMLLSAFGLLALVLGSVGAYGVTAFAVSRRTRELGVRLALGADHRGVTAMVLGEGLLPVGLGLVAGGLLGAAASRLLASLLFEVHPLDPATFVAVPLVLLGVSAVAVWIPARRAGRVDPVVSLRAE